jgi:hypothetical protein
MICFAIVDLGIMPFLSTRYAIHGSQCNWWRKKPIKPWKELATHGKLQAAFSHTNIGQARY